MFFIRPNKYCTEYSVHYSTLVQYMDILILYNMISKVIHVPRTYLIICNAILIILC